MPKNADFEAEVGYLGALRMDGTPLWAKNMELLVHGAEAKTTETKHRPGAFLTSRQLAPDGKGGVWVFTQEGKPNGMDRIWLVHVAPDGTALERRELALSGLSVIQGGRSVEVTPDGTVYCIATRNGEPRLVRIDAKGGWLVMSHMEPLRVDGAELPAASLIVLGSTPTGMTAAVRMRADGTVSSLVLLRQNGDAPSLARSEITACSHGRHRWPWWHSGQRGSHESMR